MGMLAIQNAMAAMGWALRIPWVLEGAMGSPWPGDQKEDSGLRLRGGIYQGGLGPEKWQQLLADLADAGDWRDWCLGRLNLPGI